MIDHVSLQQIDNNVSLADVDKHVIFQINWLLLSHEHTISNSQVLNQVRHTLQVKLDLEVSASVLLCSLLILIRNDEVIDYMLLQHPKDTG